MQVKYFFETDAMFYGELVLYTVNVKSLEEFFRFHPSATETSQEEYMKVLTRKLKETPPVLMSSQNN